MSGAATPSAVHVDVRRISQRFRSGRQGDLLALDRVDLQARRGEFVSIVGPSGCGKSTLLYIVAGLLQASDGQVLVDGGSMDNVPADIVKAMGADRVIAINVGDLTDREGVSYTMLGVAGNTLDAMMRASTRRAIASADVVINVPLS